MFIIKLIYVYASSIRTRSPRIAPPVKGDDGSTAKTAGLYSEVAKSFAREAVRVDFPAPLSPSKHIISPFRSCIVTFFKAIKVSNIIAIIGLINVPIIKYSVDWWNTLHQPSSIKLDGTSAIHSSMLLPLMLMLLVLLLYCALILLMKYKTEIIRIKKKNIRRI